MPAETRALKLPGTPKPWMNRAVMAMLRMPGLRSVMGRTFVILTVTGAKTGTRYTTPVQYVRDGNRLLVLSQRHRIWWRNIRAVPAIEMVLKGTTINTAAHVAEGDEALAAIAACLRINPRLAKFYKLDVGPEGEPSDGAVQQLDAAFVVIVIDHSA